MGVEMNTPAPPKLKIEIPQDKIADFCRRHHIRKLSLFGSVLRDDFGPESDIDVLVEFEPEHVPGLFRLASMEFELAEILGGKRKVDMNTAGSLSRYFRDKVLAEAQVQYVRG
jgi:predicted nucleotidyltransferase